MNAFGQYKKRGDRMRGKTLMLLAVLCGMLFMVGWLSVEAERLEQECSALEAEIVLLQNENAQLLITLTELQNGAAGLGHCQVVWQR